MGVKTVDIYKIEEDLESIHKTVLPSLNATIEKVHEQRLNVLKVRAHLKKLSEEKEAKTPQEYASRKLKIEKNLVNNLKQYLVSDVVPQSSYHHDDSSAHHNYHHHHHHNHHHHPPHHHHPHDQQQHHEHDDKPVFANFAQLQEEYSKRMLDFAKMCSEQHSTLENLCLNQVDVDQETELMPLISQHLLFCGITRNSSWNFNQHKLPPNMPVSSFDTVGKLQSMLEDYCERGDDTNIVGFLDEMTENFTLSRYRPNSFKFILPRNSNVSNPSLFKIYVKLIQSQILFYKNQKQKAMHALRTGTHFLELFKKTNTYERKDSEYIENLEKEYSSFNIRLNNSFDNTIYLRNSSLVESLLLSIQDVVQTFSIFYFYSHDMKPNSLLEQCCYAGIFTLMSIFTNIEDHQFMVFKRLGNRLESKIDQEKGSKESLYSWYEDQDANFEVVLPKSLQKYHPNFLCPVARTQFDPVNDPPKALPCGHILSARTVSQMMTCGSLRCPYCTVFSSKDEIKSIQFFSLS